MTASKDDDTRRYRVVVNAGAQYSIWPENEKNPHGWRSIGKSGTQQECLDYVREVWADMRPLGLRRLMEARTLPN